MVLSVEEGKNKIGIIRQDSEARIKKTEMSFRATIESAAISTFII
jgi:hypothetical protein